MKILFDFLPIFVFFISYKFYGIYIATILILLVTLAQTGFMWFKHKKIELNHLITMVLVIVLGLATIFLRNELFIKWKPTAIYWVFAVLFFGSQFVGKKSFLELMVGQKVALPSHAWRVLSMSWTIFFLIMGIVNLYVAYNFSTDVWVNFKLFGSLGATIVFVILQSFYMGKYLKDVGRN